MSPIQEGLWCGGVALQIGLLAKLYQQRLFRRYPFLFSYLVFSLLRGAALFYYRPTGGKALGPGGYGLVYALTQPVLWLLYFLLILELFSLVLEQFPGFQRLGQLTLWSTLGVLGLAYGALVVFDQYAGAETDPVLPWLVLHERTLFISLSILALVLLSFAVVFRLPIRRNVLVLCACFGLYFTANGILLTVRRYLGAEFAPMRSLLNSLIYGLVMLGALLFVNRAGEAASRSLAACFGRRQQEMEAAVMFRLESYNKILMRVLRQ